jgi:hypothetical protein
VETREVTTFIEDEEGNVVSRSAFRRMRKARKHELMVHWFLQNYEDPAHRTSYESAKGGYLWNWGGPFDTRDELGDKFSGIASDSRIDEVVRELEAGGISHWAPTPGHEHYYEVTTPDEEWEFERFSDAPSDSYGSQDELAARRRIIGEIEDLERVIAEQKVAGIGHNNPPSDDIEQIGTPEFSADLRKLRGEFNKENPFIGAIKKIGIALRDALIASLKWVGRKLDKAVDVAIDHGLPFVGSFLAIQHHEEIKKLLDGLFKWLWIAAQQL